MAAIGSFENGLSLQPKLAVSAQPPKVSRLVKGTSPGSTRPELQARKTLCGSPRLCGPSPVAVPETRNLRCAKTPARSSG